jgi:hypothetical protein
VTASERKGLPSAGGLLIIALIALKLAGVIGWPWWEVLLPVWFGLAALFLFASYALTTLLVGHLSDLRADRAECRALKRRPPHLTGRSIP